MEQLLRQQATGLPLPNLGQAKTKVVAIIEKGGIYEFSFDNGAREVLRIEGCAYAAIHQDKDNVVLAPTIANGTTMKKKGDKWVEDGRVAGVGICFPHVSLYHTIYEPADDKKEETINASSNS